VYKRQEPIPSEIYINFQSAISNGDRLEPYHPMVYNLQKREENGDKTEYYLRFQSGMNPVPEELMHGKEVEVQVDDKFQIFGHYKHPILDFDNSELDMDELLNHIPKKITIWY
jgi:hypothetical protein